MSSSKRASAFGDDISAYSELLKKPIIYTYRATRDRGLATVAHAYEDIVSLEDRFLHLGRNEFGIRLVRMSAHGVDVEDHVLQWPLCLTGEGTPDVKIRRGVLPETEASGQLTRFAMNFDRTIPQDRMPICCVCQTSGATGAMPRIYYGQGVYEGDEMPTVTVVEGHYYYCCDRAQCMVAIRNHLKAMPDNNMTTQLICGACPNFGKWVCSGCKSVKYCSPQCQALGWAQHKGECKAMDAARKAAKADKQREGIEKKDKLATKAAG